MGWTPGPGPTSGDDTYVGDNTDETVSGGDGNDTLQGGGGNDTLNGDAGNDTLYGEAGNDFLNGGDGADDIVGNAGDDTIHGDAGNDDIQGGGGNDVIYGGDGNDQIDVGNGNDVAFGGSGDDIITRLFGDLGVAMTGVLTVDGGDGYDVLDLRGGSLDAGSSITGIEAVVLENYANTTFVDPHAFDSVTTILGLSGRVALATPGVMDLSNLVAPSDFTWRFVPYSHGTFIIDGSSGADTILAPRTGGGAVNINGLDGDDTITGGDAGDSLLGNAGNDTVDGGAGDDALVWDAGNDILNGGAGNDRIIIRGASSSGVLTINGGDGAADVLEVSSGTLAAGTTVTGMEILVALQGTPSDILYYTPGIFAGMALYAGGGVLAPLTGGVTDFSAVSAPASWSTGQASSSNARIFFIGSSGADVFIIGADHGVRLQEAAGNDGDDQISGGTRDDNISGGNGADILTGNDGNDVLSGNFGNDTLTGNNGNDIQYGDVGSDTLTGNDGNDILNGGDGDDILNGGAGFDYATFSGNRNEYSVQDNNGVVTVSGPDGNDTLTGINSLVFDDGVFDLPGVTLTGTNGADALAGTERNDTLSGSAGDDTLNGDDGNDILAGGDGNDVLNGGLGADMMSGGTGNDVYYVDNVNDSVAENTNEGVDVALVSVSGYTLAANVEVAAIQNGSGLTLTGNSSSNILYGAAGNDTLNGGGGDDTLQGGAGADTMNGGLGNDTFYVAQVGDTVIEAAGQGTDATIVQMTAAYTLAANVEIGATFLSSGVNITGNGLDNLLYGNAGNDALAGADGNDTIQGNAGADTMIGGLGNDTYFVEDAGDVVTENSGEGTDAAIVFTDSYTLTANVEIGARFLTTAYTLTGNALDNQLYGNNGDDTLNGGDGNDTIQGGGGNDTMVGGLGNDTYLVEQAGDVVTENNGEGNDAVIVLISSYTLAANIEVGATFLTSGVSITGNGLDNRLYGNNGADTLNGGAGADLLEGGAGADTLTGGSENDTFTFVAGQGNGDTITDFAGSGAAAGDVLRFSGYGTSGGGATFIQLDATHWQINSADGTIHDTITLANGASVDASDWLFV